MVAAKRPVLESLRRDHIIELLGKGQRVDGRKLTEQRKLTIETNVIEKANGSARVSLGDTEVIAGVKIELGTPFPDTPDKAILIVNAEVLPIASPQHEPGPPDEEVIELSRVVDRGIRESEMIDLSKLVIIPGQKVYAVFIDISVINLDGNLIEACSCAAVTALATAKMKSHELSSSGEFKQLEDIVPLPTNRLPVSITVAKIGESLLVDPSMDEESVMDARLTLTTDDDGNFCAGQKGEPGGFSIDEVFQVSENALASGKEVRELMKKVIEGAKEGKETS